MRKCRMGRSAATDLTSISRLVSLRSILCYLDEHQKRCSYSLLLLRLLLLAIGLSGFYSQLSAARSQPVSLQASCSYPERWDCLSLSLSEASLVERFRAVSSEVETETVRKGGQKSRTLRLYFRRSTTRPAIGPRACQSSTDPGVHT